MRPAEGVTCSACMHSEPVGNLLECRLNPPTIQFMVQSHKIDPRQQQITKHSAYPNCQYPCEQFTTFTATVELTQ